MKIIELIVMFEVKFAVHYLPIRGVMCIYTWKYSYLLLYNPPPHTHIYIHTHTPPHYRH